MAETLVPYFSWLANNQIYRPLQVLFFTFCSIPPPPQCFWQLFFSILSKFYCLHDCTKCIILHMINEKNTLRASHDADLLLIHMVLG